MAPKAPHEALPQPLRTCEGLGVLHLFYRVNLNVWRARTSDERAVALDYLETLLTTARQQPQTQILTLAMFTRADLGFIIITPDFHDLNALEKSITSSLGPDVLSPRFTYLSLTDKTDYGPDKTTPKSRLEPTLPNWEYVCFYPLTEKRGIDFSSANKRSAGIPGQLRVEAAHAGRVRQIVTVSSGLDDWACGVTLFAHDPLDLKAVVQERTNLAHHDSSRLGPMHNGLPLPLKTIYRRVLLVV
ncbi:MAG: chlorite dismutase family protein [Methylacidiphilales bacterium]|nr:chlorite dismutase family protein [Candidatus Methylacidiphilales bacterium]